MKTYNHMYTTTESFRNYLDYIGLDCSARLLVRIHTTIHTAETARGLVREVASLLPNAVLIGCSTAQIICEGSILSGCLISITETESCTLQLQSFPCVADGGAETDAAALAGAVTEGFGTSAAGQMVLFFPLTYHKIAKFINQASRQLPGIRMIGGTAYVGDEAYQNAESTAFVIAGTGVYHDRMAAVLISAPGLSLYGNSVCGVENVGSDYEVTKVHAHYLDEIEQESAAAWYEEQLGRDELQNNPQLVGIFPLITEQGNRWVAYNVVYESGEARTDDLEHPGSRIRAFTEIDEGSRFSLGYFDPGKIVQELDTVYADLQERPVEVLFAYDCLSRMWMLHDCAKWEIGQFGATNMSGAMLAGEISNVGGRNIYANSTFVLAGLSEHPEPRILLKGRSLKDISALQHDNLQMIDYLLKRGKEQLGRRVAQQQAKMQKALFFHAGLGIGNQEKYLLEREKLRLDKIALFALENERLVKLFMGHTAFFKTLRSAYEDTDRLLGSTDFILYSYNDCSLLVAAGSQVTDDAFLDKMKALQEFLTNLRYNEVSFQYSCAVVMHEDEPLQKAETALRFGERDKVPFVVYSEPSETGESAREEMQMLQVLRDALMQDRVVPYFQAIMDNRVGRVGMYEALVRIVDKDGKVYYPGQFLSVAKEYNLYETLSNVMVKKVMQLFLRRGESVTINLNVQDIYERDMLRMIFIMLDEAEHPENFIFELVESEEVRDYEFIKQFADSIHQRGARIAIDDFGSGFSNLLHMVRLDSDIVKIDGAIVKDICTDPTCQEFVRMIGEWCRRRGKEVVAEYVENEEIQRKVEECGITYSQGYYFARPEPFSKVDAVST